MKPLSYEKNRQKKKWEKLKPVINVLSSVTLASSILMPLARPVESHAQLPIQKRTIDAGGYHSLAIGSDGSVYVWGWNSSGQVGDGTSGYNNYRTTPVKVQGLNNVVAVAAGDYHSLALTSDGSVYAWGANGDRQLGDGTYYNRTTPVKVQGLNNVVEIAAGSVHSLALTADGSVYAWGNNGVGQLGDGTSGSKNYRATPVKVQGLSNVVEIVAGSGHSLALTSDGSVYAWGQNNYGQLGDGTTTTRTTPVKVQGLSNVVAIAAGLNTSFALTSDGSVYAWGSDTAGKFGDPSFKGGYSTIPIKVQGLSNVVAIEVEWYHSLALTTDGSVYAWGLNSVGQVGDGTSGEYNYRPTPVKVQGLSNVVAIAAGGNYSLALTADGSIYAWGNNYYGQLGDGTSGNYRTTPVKVNGFQANVNPNTPGDTTPPDVPVIYADTTTPTNGNVTVTIDYPSDAVTKEYRINGGEWVPYTSPIIMTDNGTIEARAIDQAGNVSQIASYEVTNIDKNAPQLPKVEVYPDKVILTPGDDNGENTSIFYRVNNGAWTKYDNPLTLPDGVYDIQAKTVDEAGNESEVVDVKVVLYGEQLAKTQQAVKDAVSLKTQSAIDAALAELEALPDNAPEKASLLEQLDQVQNEVAQQLVNKAMQNPTPENIEEARQSVNKVKDETLKDQLQQQLQNLEDKMEIHAPAIKVTNGQIIISNDSNNEGNYMILYRVNGGEWKEYKGDISLPDGNYVIEAKVVDQLGNESPVTSITTTIYAQQLDKAQQAVNQALSLKTQSAIDKAVAEVEKLPNNASEKAEMLQQLDQLQNELAQQLVNEALQNPTQENIDKAKQAVEKVKDSTLKKQLQEQLKEMEESLKMSKEAYLALKAIERAEKYTASSMVKYAYQKFNEVPENDKDKEMLRERLEQLQAKYDSTLSDAQKSQAYKIAEAKVKALEIAYSPTLLRLAQEAVDALPDGDDKDILQARIDNVVSSVQNSMNAKKIEEAEKAVANAEKYKIDYYIKKATELVAQLPDGETKQTLQQRLDALKQTPSEDEIAYQKALDAVNLANKYKIAYYKKKALEAINLVKDETKKQELLQMLNENE